MTEYLSEAEVIDIHSALAEMFANEDPIDPPGVRDTNLLGSALARPLTGLGSVDKYDTLEKKAAALFHSLVKNHPFHNGNKRTALVALIVFLDRNNRILSDVIDDDLFTFVIGVAADTFPKPDHSLGHDAVVEAIAAWLRNRTQAKTAPPRNLRTTEFLERVVDAGGRWKESGSSYVVWGTQTTRSVRIARTTSSLDGNVVKSYLRKLGLSEGQSGIAFQEFLDGVRPEQEALRRFRNVLRNLANA